MVYGISLRRRGYKDDVENNQRERLSDADYHPMWPMTDIENFCKIRFAVRVVQTYGR